MEDHKSTHVGFLFDKPLRHWWGTLEEDRASRAILRRCATLDAVALSVPYQRFYRYMLGCGWPPNARHAELDKLAAIAGLLAHVKTDASERLSATMSPLNADLLVSELRFRDLLKIETTDDLFVSLRRALPLVKHTANVEQLARDVYGWNDEVKKQWAYSYRWPAK
ncbi:CRISPR system Cascade subunit CasB [Janthinobacterium sp. CG_23.3]|uniref:type I-E CRISPR-associated protein Cse2/CasB n=1 Tax=Janthinobacterium sp. CG_23.3 TaxID=3349634 RepID=UPI0038D3750D